MGDINVFSGPMKSGKSMQIINEFNRQQFTGKNIMLFKPKLDNRMGNNIIGTRNGIQIEAQNIENIEELQNYNADVFFIDEFQFLNGDVKTIEKLAEKGRNFLLLV